jgi:hypothetical protein
MADYIHYAVIRAIEIEELVRSIRCFGNCRKFTYIDVGELSEQDAGNIAMQFSLHITRQLQ